MREKQHFSARKGLRRWLHAPITLLNILLHFGWQGFRLRILLRKVQYQMTRLTPSVYAGFVRPTKIKLKHQRAAARSFQLQCRFGIVYLGNEAGAALNELHSSLTGQSYPEWTLLISSEIDASGLARTVSLPDSSLAYPSPETLRSLECTHYVFLKPGTLPAPDALYEIADYWNHHPDAGLVYTDDFYFESSEREPFHYHFKPDFSPVTLCGFNYIGMSWSTSKDMLSDLNDLAGQSFPAAGLDLIFRLYERSIPIGHVPKPLFGLRSSASGIDPVLRRKDFSAAEAAAVRSHLDRTGISAAVEPIGDYPCCRIRPLLSDHPLVSILIPNRDHSSLLKQCVDSILTKSTFRNFEIVILENNSREPETETYYHELEQLPEIRIVRCCTGEPFNYSRLNNCGVRHCRGEYLVFLNNDTEVITPEWLEEMLFYARQKSIGAVGVKLFFSNRTIQHGGVMVGFRGAADHLFLHAAADDPGYAGQLMYARNCSAVTFACCMIRRDVFDSLGGLDEEFTVSFNDVDFCLQLLAAGYQIVWTPWAELYHYESISRGYDDSVSKNLRLQQEIQRLHKKWLDFLMKEDPFYNPNFSRLSVDFQFRHPAENRLFTMLLNEQG